MSDIRGQDTTQVVAEGQQQSAMSTENKPAEVISTQPEPTGQLPEGVSERTKLEFEKLKEANRLLAEQVKAQKQPETRQSVFDQFKPLAQPAAPVVAPQAPLETEDGYIDGSVLTQRMALLEEQARRAQEEARRAQEEIANFQLTAQQKAVFAKYPELDPSSDRFDPAMTKRVSNEIFGQLSTVGREDYMSAADSVFSLFKPTETPQQIEEQKKVIQAKEQINANPATQASSQSQQGTSQNLEELREATRKGDPRALEARLKALGM